MFQEREMEKLANKMLEIPREKLSFFIYKIKYDWRGEKKIRLKTFLKIWGFRLQKLVVLIKKSHKISGRIG